MLNRIYVGKSATGFQKNLLESPVTGVRLVKSEGVAYEAGDMNGKVWEYENPYATQEMANKVLEDIRGYTYLGYEASNVVIDPLAELADGVTVSGNYSMLAYKKTTFSPSNVADIAAPGTNEPDDEYPYKSQADRKLDTDKRKIYSRFEKTDEHITAEVNRFQGTVDEYKQQVSTFDQTVSGFRTQVGEYEKSVNGYSEQVSNFSQTVDGFRGDVRSYQESVNGYSEKVAEFNGTVNGFKTKVSQYEESVKGYTNKVSEFSQTVDGFKATVSDYGNAVSGYAEKVSQFEQTAGKISWLVKSGDNQTNFEITDRLATLVSNRITLSVSGASIELKGADGLSRGSGTIEIEGMVTFTDLSTKGSTTINGGNITTGKLIAERVEFKDFSIGSALHPDQFVVDEDGNITIGSNVTFTSGCIKWADVSGSSTVDQNIADAKKAGTDAADDLEKLAKGEYTKAGKTFINGKEIYAPTIYTNELKIFPDVKTQTGSLTLYGYDYGSNVAQFVIEYDSRKSWSIQLGADSYPVRCTGYTSISTNTEAHPIKFENTLVNIDDSTYLVSEGTSYFTGIVYLRGTVDFTDATSVKGLDKWVKVDNVTAKFG